jgi:hypothetical protein
MKGVGAGEEQWAWKEFMQFPFQRDVVPSIYQNQGQEEWKERAGHNRVCLVASESRICVGIKLSISFWRYSMPEERSREKRPFFTECTVLVRHSHLSMDLTCHLKGEDHWVKAPYCSPPRSLTPRRGLLLDRNTKREIKMSKRHIPAVCLQWMTSFWRLVILEFDDKRTLA